MSTLTQTQEALPTGAWQIDPVHSQVGFAVDYLVGTFRGTFSPFEARLEVDADGEATLTGSARADSVHVLDENLNAHLLAPDFFDAERAPLLSFTSTDVRRSGADVRVAGELTIKGVAVPVELTGTIGDPIAHPMGGERLGLEFETTVDRRAFGIDWNLELPSGEPALANDVSLTAQLFLVKE
jgi:polyisoprenoid-binding protein YceI